MHNFIFVHDRVLRYNVQFYFVHDRVLRYNVQFYFVHDRVLRYTVPSYDPFIFVHDPLLERKFMSLVLRLSLRMAEVEETVVDTAQSDTHCVNASG
jgi:hypothetical protein